MKKRRKIPLTAGGYAAQETRKNEKGMCVILCIGEGLPRVLVVIGPYTFGILDGLIPHSTC